MSTRNAGAKASPAEVPLNRPSKPGTTHHQGRGSSPLKLATKGFSIFNRLRIVYSTRQPITDASLVMVSRAWS